MGENDTHKPDEPQAEKIEDVLRERERLDKILQTKFTKRMAILFSDVCGYTQYMDTRAILPGGPGSKSTIILCCLLSKKMRGKCWTLWVTGSWPLFPPPFPQ